jgi:PB1 domain
VPNNANNNPSQPSRSKSSSGRDSINSRTTEGPCPVPEQSQPQLGRVLLEDSGSSKDLEDLCGEAPLHNLLTVTIKASYKEDIIRFRFVVPGSLVMLREDVSGRLKIEIGTFEIKYLDDDQQWVKLASDSDLEECMEIARVSSKYRIVRLLVSDIGVNLGSSCESTGGVNELNLYSNCKLYLCRVFVSLALHFG